VDLKFLSLDFSDHSGEAFGVICELKNLETLVLEGISDSGLNLLHKLKNLKRLRVGFNVSWYILDHLKFGVFNDLKELDAHFIFATMETIQEMKPNLKKLVIRSAPISSTVNVFLETLESLESVKILDDWEMSGKVCPSIKQLHVKTSGFKFNAELMKKQLPNLEDLKISDCSLDVTESFFIELLSGLEQLKTLYMRILCCSSLAPTSALQLFQEYGNHLEEASIIFVCEPKDYVYAIEKNQEPLFTSAKIMRSIHRGYFNKIMM
jgi:hypothetical protein